MSGPPHTSSSRTRRRVRRSLPRAFRAPRCAAVLGVLLLAGCGLDSVDPPEQFRWEANVQSPLEEDVPIFTGTVSMLTAQGLTELAIFLSDSVPGTRFGWSIGTGTCEEPGDLVADEGVFEEFTIDEAGEGGRLQPLAGQVRGDLEYSTRIYRGEEDGGALLLCQQMNRIF